jgi:hypothetical protein
MDIQVAPSLCFHNVTLHLCTYISRCHYFDVPDLKFGELMSMPILKSKRRYQIPFQKYSNSLVMYEKASLLRCLKDVIHSFNFHKSDEQIMIHPLFLFAFSLLPERLP